MRISDWSSDVCSSDLQCMAKLTSQSVLFTPLPDQNFGGGCSATGSVKLIDIGVPATNLGAMTCGLAANFAAWARYGVQPAARLILGAEVERIETFGTYSCRPIAGSGKRSEEHTSELQSLMRLSYAVLCLKKKKKK